MAQPSRQTKPQQLDVGRELVRKHVGNKAISNTVAGIQRSAALHVTDEVPGTMGPGTRTTKAHRQPQEL